MHIAGVVLATLASVVGETSQEKGAAPVVVPQAEQIDLTSKAGREYRLFIKAPGKEDPAPPDGYPVYYFTDANTSFAMVASLARILQPTIGPVVLVGIGYPTDDRNEIAIRRAYDLTPVAAADAIKRFQESRKADPTSQRKGFIPRATDMKLGGEAEFFAFIQNEVKPIIEKKFTINKSRQALFGHSFGGLFTLHTMYVHPDAFQTFVAASPSLWLNPEKLAEEEAAFTARANGTKVRLLITLGELEPRSPANKLDAGDGPHATLIRRLKAAGVDAAFQPIAGENHGSVVPFAHQRGLRFAFETARKPAEQ